MKVFDDLLEVRQKIIRVEWFRNLKFWYDNFDILNYSCVFYGIIIV